MRLVLSAVWSVLPRFYLCAGRGAPVQMSANVGNILSKLQAANAMVVNQAQEHTIHREEAIHISGGSARLLLMQKLQRKDEVKTLRVFMG